MMRASLGRSRRKFFSFSPTSSWTTGPTSEETSLSLVCDALIYQLDLDSVVQKRKLAQPPCQDVEVVLDHSEGLRAGQKMHLGATSLGLAGYLERRHRDPAPEFHKVAFPVASNGKPQ